MSPAKYLCGHVEKGGTEKRAFGGRAGRKNGNSFAFYAPSGKDCEKRKIALASVLVSMLGV